MNNDYLYTVPEICQGLDLAEVAWNSLAQSTRIKDRGLGDVVLHSKADVFGALRLLHGSAKAQEMISNLPSN
jgi:hypothetical protein